MTWLILGIGLLAGIFGGVFGVGGGVVIVPMLVLLARMNPKVAAGTSLATFVLPVALLGAIGHWRAGNVNIRASLLLAAGVFLGGWIGSQISVGLSELALKRAFAVVLVLVATRLWMTA